MKNILNPVGYSTSSGSSTSSVLVSSGLVSPFLLMDCESLDEASSTFSLGVWPPARVEVVETGRWSPGTLRVEGVEDIAGLF